MASRFKVRPLPLMVLGALVACLTFAAEGRAQGRKGPPAKPPNQDAKKKLAGAANQQKKLAEVDVLVKAYILLAEANHDYDGHRVKAMNHIKQAVKVLDASVMAKGTPMQKAQAAMQARAGAAAGRGQKGDAVVHENQAASDKQVRAALELLVTVHAAMTGDKFKDAKGHVAKAVGEAKTALKIR